jgi:uncharacterized protein (TIGR02453 family)
MKKTIDFLKSIKLNNNKDWFDKNKEQFLDAKSEYEAFIDSLITGIHKFDKKISADMKGKDKTPYKTNFGASINPGGKKSLLAGYYIHIEPGASFLAGGVYMPEPALLNTIRQEIDYNTNDFLKILKSASFKKYFKGLDEEGKLKTAPKGFEKDHPHIELLKNKHFVVSHFLNDKQLEEKNFGKTILDGFKAMHPFLEFLRAATA